MNEEVIEKLDGLLEEVKTVEVAYKTSLQNRLEDLDKQILEVHKKYLDLQSECEGLKKQTEQYKEFLSLSSSKIEDNNKTVDGLQTRSESLSNSISELEERLAILMQSLSSYEACKSSVDEYIQKQNSLKIELHNLEVKQSELASKNSSNTIREMEISGKLKTLSESEVYKAIVEKDGAALEALLNIITDYVVENIEVKSAMFSKKLVQKKK